MKRITVIKFLSFQKMLQSFLIFISIFIWTVSSETVTVEGLGKITGRVSSSRNQKKYYSFYGIPYATVPHRFGISKRYDQKLNTQSFKDPVEPCAQNAMNRKSLGVEDCLTLDVHTRHLNSGRSGGKQFPVIVYFAPGGFQSREKSTINEPKFFMDYDVVLVQISSRLGVLGYLSTGDGEVQGNMGLKDQVLALEWIRSHISAFGGSQSVTLLGLSSGAATAIYHMLSPMSEGLFRQVIAISGTPLNPWATQYRQGALFETFVSKTSCERISKTEVKKRVECLKELPVQTLLKAEREIATLSVPFDLLNMRFVPCTEKRRRGPVFIESSPRLRMQIGNFTKVPLIIGFTENEGGFFTALLSTRPADVERLDQEWDVMAPKMFYLDEYSGKKAGQILKPLKETYFPNGKITPKNLQPLTDLFSERYITNGVIETIQTMRDYTTVYPYMFKHKGDKSIIQYYFKGVESPKGVCHLDELLYMFNDTVGATEAALGGSDYRDFSQKYINWIQMFATSGTAYDTFKDKSKISPWTKSEKGTTVVFNIIDNSVSNYAFDVDNSDQSTSKNQPKYPNPQRTNYWYTIRKSEDPITPLKMKDSDKNSQYNSPSRSGIEQDMYYDEGGAEDEVTTEGYEDFSTVEPYLYGRLNDYYDCIRFNYRDVNVCIKWFRVPGSIPPFIEIQHEGTTVEPTNNETQGPIIAIDDNKGEHVHG